MIVAAITVVVIFGRFMSTVRADRPGLLVVMVDVYGDLSAAVRQIMRGPRSRWPS